jgi:hypothetical protein
MPAAAAGVADNGSADNDGIVALSISAAATATNEAVMLIALIIASVAIGI